MENATADKADQLVFQISNDDFGPLFVDRLRLECSSLSPLSKLLAGYARGSRPATAGADEIAAHPLFPKAAAILAEPDLRMLHRTGGGSRDVSYFTAYRKRSVAQNTIVTVTPSFENSTLVRVFHDPDAYLAWWLETLAAPVENPSPNYIPPPTRLESLVYLLHAVDSFRRASFQSMLSYSPTEDPSIGTGEFAETMNTSMGSRDLRWLLPAFLYLTPGLDEFSFNPGPDHLAALAEHDFLLTARKPGSDKDVFLFGEAGRTMGVEFYRTWLMAAGFETVVLTPSGQRTLNRGFFAPTALANHLIRLKPDGDGGCVANHQALTLEELAGKMRGMLLAALEGQPADL